MNHVKCRGDLWTAWQLARVFNAERDPKYHASSNAVARTLNNLGRAALMNGNQVKIDETTRDRYYPIRDHEKWYRVQTADKIRDHVLKTNNDIRKAANDAA